MKDEIERYKRLLQDWHGGSGGNSPSPETKVSPPPVVRAPTPPPRMAESAPRMKLSRPTPPEAEEGRFPNGAILCLNDEELVVYRRPVAGQPLDMVYSLLADGSVKIEALELSRYQISEMGILPPAELRILQAKARWTRALIVTGCAKPEDADRVPDPGGVAETLPQEIRTPPPVRDSERLRSVPSGSYDGDRDEVGALSRQESAVPVEPAADENKVKIRRGQWITLKFGNKTWEAVYWGKDRQGPVVAHNTHKHWSLMHLDLDRFKETMIVSPEPDQDAIEQILSELATRTD